MNTFLRKFRTSALLVTALLATAASTARADSYLDIYLSTDVSGTEVVVDPEGSLSTLTANVSGNDFLGGGAAFGSVSLSSENGILRSSAFGISTSITGGLHMLAGIQWSDVVLTTCFELPESCTAVNAVATLSVTGVSTAVASSLCAAGESECTPSQSHAEFSVFFGEHAPWYPADANSNAEGSASFGTLNLLLDYLIPMAPEINVSYGLTMGGYAIAGSSGSAFFDVDVAHTVGLTGFHLLDADGNDVSSRYNISWRDGTQMLAAVPEPQTWTMLLAGLALLGQAVPRARRRSNIAV